MSESAYYESLLVVIFPLSRSSIFYWEVSPQLLVVFSCPSSSLHYITVLFLIIRVKVVLAHMDSPPSGNDYFHP